MKTFCIRIHQKGGFPNNFPYLFRLDEIGLPIEMITFEAEDEEEAVKLVQTNPVDLGIPEDFVFESFRIEEYRK